MQTCVLRTNLCVACEYVGYVQNLCYIKEYILYENVGYTQTCMLPENTFLYANFMLHEYI